MPASTAILNLERRPLGLREARGRSGGKGDRHLRCAAEPVPVSSSAPRATRSVGGLAGLVATAVETTDPVGLAREVLRGDDFWWKRLEPGKSPEIPWLAKIAVAILELLYRLWTFVWDVIRALLRLLFGRIVGEGSSGTTLIWILAIGIILWAAWKLVPLLRRGEGRVSPAANPEAVALEPLAAASELREQASRALSQGRHAEAIRLALLALIAALEQRGLLRYDTTRTNREYRTELTPRPDLAERFGRLARIYERVWYGREPAGREQAEESIRLCAAPIDGEAVSPG